MKNLITLLLILTTFLLRAQKPQNGPQAGSEQKMYGVAMPVIKCGGQANMQSADLDWQPILVRKIAAMPHNGPQQEYIERVKNEKLKQKQESEGRHNSDERTTSVHPVLGTNFAGNTYGGISPLDNSVAVSDSGYVVSVSNSKIAFYKTDGTSLYVNNISTFLPFGGTPVSSPVVMYDTRANRFILVCQQLPMSDTGKIFIAFSQTSSPTSGWWCYSLLGDASGGGEGFDFPRIAVNDSELFITGNLYTAPGTTSSTFDKGTIFQMDKLAGMSGLAMSSIYYPFISGSPFCLLPVSDGQTTGIPTGMYLINTTSTGGNLIYIYRIIGNWCCLPTMIYSSAYTTPYTVPGNAQQLGASSLLNVGDCRALSAFMLNGIIHFVFSSDAGTGYCGINYNRLDPVADTNRSTVFGVSGFDYAYPSIASYSTTTTNPSVMVGFVNSGSTIYPEVMVVNCDSVMSWSGTTLVKAGASYNGATTGVVPWGAYTGAARKHNSATPSIWMNGMFSNSSHTWDTWVAEIHDATTTPCGAPTGLSVTGISFTTATLHWNAVGGAINYYIQYRPVSATSWTNTTSTTNSKALTGLLTGIHYVFQVEAMCSDSSLGSYSSTDTFIMHGIPAGIETVYGADGSKVFPNPVTSNFSLEFSLENNCSLEISVEDMNGRLVKNLYSGKGSEGLNEFSFNKANLANGVYFIRIAADGLLKKTEKIVVAE